jgi:hypothetical protein
MDIGKRIEEQRHAVAIQMVNLNICKDTYEAKQGIRSQQIEASDYKFKHLLYKQ